MNFISTKIFLIVFLLTFPLASVLSDSNWKIQNGSAKNNELLFTNNEALQKYLENDFILQFQGENFSFKPKDFSLWEMGFTLQPEYSSEIERSTLCEADFSQTFIPDNSPIDKTLSICELTNTIRSAGHFRKGAILEIDKSKVDEFVSVLNEKIASAPKNAKVKMVFEKSSEIITNEKIQSPLESEESKKIERRLKIIEPARSGFSLDEERSAETIITALKNPNANKTLQLQTKEEKPKISKETLADLKINEQIGHGESNFAGSPKNRIFNINLSADKFDGILLEPGEEFSFVNILGPVEKETGYKEELVIKENKTIPEYGGGVCQVSTTVFRAALNTGLKITERQNHSYPVQYYSPQGTDATIYLPKPDLRFLNNTPSFIFFQASIEGKKLIFDIFGESDGRKVEMKGPKVTERTPEGILKVELKQLVTDKNGDLVFEDTFESVYDNPAKYHETELLSKKPDNWSNKQWDSYKKSHNL